MKTIVAVSSGTDFKDDYKKAKALIDTRIKDLQSALKKHEGKNWGSVGDLNHAASELKDITDFLS